MQIGGSIAKPKTKVTFFIGQSLLVGRGYQNTTLNFAKNMDPGRFEVNIIHTDFMPAQRIDSSVIDELPGFITVNQVKSKVNRFRNSLIGRIRHIPLGKVWETLFLAPPFWWLMSSVLKVKEWKSLSDTDIIYLADNVDVHLFRSFKGKIAGSNQGMFENPKSVYTRLVVRLIQANLILRRISGYHLFPMNKSLENRFKNKICTTFPSGLDSEKFVPVYGRDEKRPVKLLFIASLEEFKGIRKAIDAFNLISGYNDVEFHIGGTGPLRGEVELAAKGNEKIRYHGVLTPQEVSNLYGSCDILLYPSLGETFGLVVLEAVSSGMHAIVGRNLKGNFGDLDSHGYVTYCDYTPENIARMLLDEISHFPREDSTREKMHDVVSKGYDWKIVTEKLMDFLESVVKG